MVYEKDILGHKAFFAFRVSFNAPCIKALYV